MPKKEKKVLYTINPKVEIKGLIKSNYKFTISNINVSIANAIRRTILTDIKTVVIKEKADDGKMLINILENTSQFNNQILIQRLGCIPVYNCSDGTNNEVCLRYELQCDMKNDKNEILNITTEHFDIKDLQTDKYLKKSDVAKIFPPNKISKDYIIFARLKPKVSNDIPGEAIKFNAKFSLANAKENSMYNVVSTCAYGNTLDQEKIYDERQKKEKELVEKKDMNESEIDKYLLNWDNHDAKRYYIENSFDFVIKSLGVYQNNDIVIKACNIIINHLEIIQTKCDKQQIELKENSIIMNNSWDIILQGYSYTIGKILEWILHYKFYMEANEMKYVGFLKPHPHNTHSIIRISYSNKANSNKNYVYLCLKEACRLNILLFKNIMKEFK
tara:strand:+ start:288 stop:1448 length:1161 start_codon:yes stop_codon:yes gene_type:complete